MRKLLVVFLLLFVLSSCVSTNGESSEEDTSVTECPYICDSGSDGISTTINHPTDGGTVYITDQFAPRIKLSDLGESSATGTVCVTGLDEEKFEGAGGCDCESFYVDLDDPDTLTYDDITLSNYYVTIDASGDYSLTAYTRYTYTTYGLFELCLSGDPDNEDDCDTSTDKNRVTGSSSGPVTVTDVTQDLSLQGSDTITLRLRVTADASSPTTEDLIRLTLASASNCERKGEEDVNTDPILVETSLVLFEEVQTGACTDLEFSSGEDEASISCKLDINTDALIGEKEWRGYVRLDYAWEERNSVNFKVTAG